MQYESKVVRLNGTVNNVVIGSDATRKLTSQKIEAIQANFCTEAERCAVLVISGVE